MAEFEARIDEIRAAGETNVLRLAVNRALAPVPGQYFSANGQQPDDFLTHALFFYHASAARLELGGNIPLNWAPGETLSLRGPLGNGFHLPAAARRVGLVAPFGDLAGLVPLIGLALGRGAGVVCCGASLPTDLPAEVEFLPPESAGELLAWADYLAVEAPFARMDALPARLKIDLANLDALPAKIEVLVHTDMPCAGTGDCGACAVTLRRGWKLACKDGPVFDFRELEV